MTISAELVETVRRRRQTSAATSAAHRRRKRLGLVPYRVEVSEADAVAALRHVEIGASRGLPANPTKADVERHLARLVKDLARRWRAPAMR